jgi:hypothetical protein
LRVTVIQMRPHSCWREQSIYSDGQQQNLRSLHSESLSCSVTLRISSYFHSVIFWILSVIFAVSARGCIPRVPEFGACLLREKNL